MGGCLKTPMKVAMAHEVVPLPGSNKNVNLDYCNNIDKEQTIDYNDLFKPETSRLRPEGTKKNQIAIIIGFVSCNIFIMINYSMYMYKNRNLIKGRIISSLSKIEPPSYIGGSYLPFHFLYKTCIKQIFPISPDPLI